MFATPTMWIDQDLTILDGTGAGGPTPADFARDGLGGLLNRVAPRLTKPAATVLLAGEVPAALDFGPKAPRLGSRRDTPPLISARKAGWQVKEERPWLICRRPEPDARGRKGERVVHVGIMPWLDRTRFPLITDDPLVVVWRMLHWHRLVGVPYHGEHAGVPGIALLRDGYTGRPTPWWRPPFDSITPANEATEVADDWRAPGPARDDQEWEHGFDVTSQYLSAAGVVRLAVGRLSYRAAPIEVARHNRPGYYRITVPPWALGDKIVHPAGRWRPGDTVWVAHPTVDLLCELAHEHGGVIAEPDVHEAWTAENDGARVLRKWSATLAQARREAAELLEGPEGPLCTTLQDVYKKGIGMLAVPTSRIYRPDWQHGIICQARCNLWRKVWAEGTTADHWPVQISADTVWYASAEEDALLDWPETFTQGDGLTGGAFTHYGSRYVGSSARADA